MALSATGQPFETIVLRLRRPETWEEILKFSSAGKVPVLKISEPGGLTVWDSLAICETLAERHPEAHLLPADAQARATARSYAAEMHSGFPDVRDQLGMDFARSLPLPELRPETSQQVARIISAWEQALTINGGDGGFLFGRFSIADCMYAPVVSRFRTFGVALPAPRSRLMRTACGRCPPCRTWLKAARRKSRTGSSERRMISTAPISR